MTEPSPGRPSSLPPVQYKGEDLDPERGPGLGCFYLQMIVLGVLLVATPVSVSMGAPSWVSAILLFATLGLLLVSGQTIIFLLRLVAADRREGRRRPLASGTRTVGELEDAHGTTTPPTHAHEDVTKATADADEPEAAPDEPKAAADPDADEPKAAPDEPKAAADPDADGADDLAAPPPPEPAEAAPPPPSDEGPVRQ